jgi:transposase
MAEIHAALTYYYDHKAEMDAEIERLDREFDAMRHAAGESQAVKKLRAKGLLP